MIDIEARIAARSEARMNEGRENIQTTPDTEKVAANHARRARLAHEQREWELRMGESVADLANCLADHADQLDANGRAFQREAATLAEKLIWND